MKNLALGDKCYKFFWSEPRKANGSESMVYEANKRYSDKMLFFFRRDEAIESVHNLCYFMGFGDSIVEIHVNQELVEKAVYSAPHHFASESFITGDIYDMNSDVVKLLIIESLRNCRDFSKNEFLDIVEKIIERGGLDTAISVYSTIVEEKKLQLTRLDNLEIMEVSSNRWRRMIPLSEINACDNLQDYICLLKNKFYEK